MPRHPWSALAEIFDAAVRLPPADRRPFLDAACADDPALRLSIDRLLAADDRVRAEHPAFLRDDAPGEARPPTGLPGR